MQINRGKQYNKTIYHLNKTEYIKRTFHVKIGMMKDRNSMNLTEAEDIKKRCQEYTEKLYKKGLNEWILT